MRQLCRTNSFKRVIILVLINCGMKECFIYRALFTVTLTKHCVSNYFISPQQRAFAGKGLHFLFNFSFLGCMKRHTITIAWRKVYHTFAHQPCISMAYSDTQVILQHNLFIFYYSSHNLTSSCQKPFKIYIKNVAWVLLLRCNIYISHMICIFYSSSTELSQWWPNDELTQLNRDITTKVPHYVLMQ